MVPLYGQQPYMRLCVHTHEWRTRMNGHEWLQAMNGDYEWPVNGCFMRTSVLMNGRHEWPQQSRAPAATVHHWLAAVNGRLSAAVEC